MKIGAIKQTPKTAATPAKTASKPEATAKTKISPSFIRTKIAAAKPTAADTSAAKTSPAAASAVSAKPVKTKIILRPVNSEVPTSSAATADTPPKPKPKFTPITAPANDSPPAAKFVSVKPRFNPISYSSQSQVGAFLKS